MQGLVEVAHAVSKERDVTVRQQFGVVLVTPGSLRHAPRELAARFVDERDCVEVPEADEDVAVGRRPYRVGVSPFAAMAVFR